MVNGGCLSHGSGPIRANRLVNGAEEAGERSERNAGVEGCAGKRTVTWGWGFFVGSRDYYYYYYYF
jgi:hypothetical protein